MPLTQHLPLLWRNNFNAAARSRITATYQSFTTISLFNDLALLQGSRIEFSLVGDHVEMRVRSSPAGEARSGFGMLKSRRAAMPTDFDPATLLKR